MSPVKNVGNIELRMKCIITHAGFHEFEIYDMEEKRDKLNTNFPFSKSKYTLYTMMQ